MLLPPALGPLVGAVTCDSATLWLRGGPDQVGVVRHRSTQSQGNGWHVLTVPLHVHLDHVGTCTIHLGKDDSSVEYEAAVVDAAQATPPSADDWKRLGDECKGTIRRPPPAGTPFSFLLGSCRHRGYGPFGKGDQAFRTIRTLQLGAEPSSFIILCGDQVYCDKRINDYFPLFPGLATDTPKDLDGYFERYRHDYGLEHFRAALRSLPAYMIFDDHEVENNWRGYQYRSVGTAPPERDPDTLRRGLTAYYAYQAIHSPVGTHNQPSTISDATILSRKWWYRFSWADCDFMVLDVRSHRDPPTASGASLLGSEQFEALKAFLKDGNDSRWKFVVSPVPIAPDTNERDITSIDTWKAYPQERLELIEFIRKELAFSPIFLSGDIHLSCIAELRTTRDEGFRLPCITSSALNWFTFGVGDVGQGIGTVRPAIEEGTLSVSHADVPLAPQARRGEYWVNLLCARELGNNFVRIDVERDCLRVEILRAATGEAAQQYAFSRHSLAIPTQHLPSPSSGQQLTPPAQGIAQEQRSNDASRGSE